MSIHILSIDTTAHTGPVVVLAPLPPLLFLLWVGVDADDDDRGGELGASPGP